MSAPDIPAAPASAPTQPADGDAAAPVPASEERDLLQGVDALRDSVSSRSNAVNEMINWLDAVGFTVGDTRFSLWTGLVVLLVLLGVYFFARIGSRFAHWVLGRVTSMDLTQKVLAEKLVTIAVWALAILIGIDLLGVDLTALAVFSGAFGLAIGFGLQKTFGNMIAGIILLMDRSIKPGDVIAVSDMSGRESFGQIRKIGIRAISVVTRDKKEYLIPNENLMVNQVENWSYSTREVRVKADVGVAYGCDLALVERLLMEAAQIPERVLKTPAPRVLLMGFGESSVDFQIRFWITDPEEGVSSIRSDVYMQVWRLFQENGIAIPFPQRDLNLRGNEQFDQLIAAISQRMAEQKKPEN